MAWIHASTDRFGGGPIGGFEAGNVRVVKVDLRLRQSGESLAQFQYSNNAGARNRLRYLE